MKNKILIIGGTSGMGLGLALAYLERGWAVWVVGSNLNKIKYLNENKPELHVITSNLEDPIQRQSLWQNLEKLVPFQIIIYCAGKYFNERRFTLTPSETASILAVNLHAFQECFAWASTRLAPSASMQTPVLACFSSAAGLLNYPYASLYALCKRNMLETAHIYRTAFPSIQILTIALGYVDTQTLRDLNQGNAQHKPFIIQEEIAVQKILIAIETQQEQLIYPPQMRYLISFMNILPKCLIHWIMRKKLDQSLLHKNPNS